MSYSNHLAHPKQHPSSSWSIVNLKLLHCIYWTNNLNRLLLSLQRWLYHSTKTVVDDRQLWHAFVFDLFPVLKRWRKMSIGRRCSAWLIDWLIVRLVEKEWMNDAVWSVNYIFVYVKIASPFQILSFFSELRRLDCAEQQLLIATVRSSRWWWYTAQIDSILVVNQGMHQ